MPGARSRGAVLAGDWAGSSSAEVKVLSRSGVMLLLQTGTSLFSDFGGIIRKEFSKNISERTSEIRASLVAAGVIDAS